MASLCPLGHFDLGLARGERNCQLYRGRCVLLYSEKDQTLGGEAIGAEQKALLGNTHSAASCALCLAEVGLPSVSGGLVQPLLSHLHTQIRLSWGPVGWQAPLVAPRSLCCVPSPRAAAGTPLSVQAS